MSRASFRTKASSFATRSAVEAEPLADFFLAWVLRLATFLRAGAFFLATFFLAGAFPLAIFFLACVLRLATFFLAWVLRLATFFLAGVLRLATLLARPEAGLAVRFLAARGFAVFFATRFLAALLPARSLAFGFAFVAARATLCSSS